MKSLFIFIIIVFGLGMLSGIATSSEISGWFATLNHPVFSPPNWVFGPVWSIIYAMIGVSGWLVWKKGKFTGRAAVFFIVQLTLNYVWTLLFFGAHQIGLALLDIVLLVILIAINIKVFLPISKRAGYLLIPYFLWVSFATALNFMYWWLN